jgi:type III secretion protein T
MIDLERQWQAVLITLALLMSRMLVAFAVIPLFAANGIPAFVRVVFVAGLSISLLPLALSDAALPAIPLANIAPYLAKEAAIGLVLGLIASAGFWALYVAGMVIEFQAGLTFASTIDPLTNPNDSLIGGLLMQLFTALFLVTGGLLSLIAMLFESYRVWPLSSMTPIVGNLQLAQVVANALTELLLTALKIAAPFVILMLIVEQALGFLSRFAPQLNVFFVALPLKVLVLAAMLVVYAMMLASSGQLLPTGDFTRALEPLRRVLP